MALVRNAANNRWRNAKLPFTIEAETFSTTELGRINRAIAHWNERTDWNVVPRTNERDYVFFRRGAGCSSFVGRVGGAQPINLSGRCGFGSVVHEIGHALGHAHEHQRRDRDSRVAVLYGRIDPDRRHNFDRRNGDDWVDRGRYDYGSIMHYSPSGFPAVQEHTWQPGDNVVRSFRIDGGEMILAFDTSARRMTMRSADATVGIGHTADVADIGRSWTVIEPHWNGRRNITLFLRTSDGVVEVREFDEHGQTLEIIDRQDWSSGWTHAQLWRAGTTSFLAIYKRGTGEVRTHRMNVDGSIGREIARLDLGDGWTTLHAYRRGAAHFLLCLDALSGRMAVFPLESSGRVGDLIETDEWTRGWTNAVTWSIGAQTYLVIVKTRTGDMHAHRISSDGRIGPRTDEAVWAQGWTSAQVLGADSGRPILLLHNEDAGNVQMHRLSRGTIGDQVRVNPPTTIAAPSRIGQRRALSDGDIEATNWLASLG